jgi:hypothetical protein
MRDASFYHAGATVYLLYLDESGGENDPADRFFVLGGVAVFERQCYFLAQEFDKDQTKHFPNIQPVEFHSTDIRGGKGFWRKLDRVVREAVLIDISQVLASSHSPGVVLFAAAIEKNARLFGEDAVKRATEEVCKRFDIILKRRFPDHGDPQRGLIVFAEGKYHLRSRLWVQGFRTLGTQWGVLTNPSDIPYFASTKETRLLQAADLVAHAVYIAHEKQNYSMVRQLLSRFVHKNGVLHGLVHVSDSKSNGDCPAWISRNSPAQLGFWANIAKPSRVTPVTVFALGRHGT